MNLFAGPRDPFEAASSLGESLLGPYPNMPKGYELAFRSITWPLTMIAQIGKGYYGNVESLSRTRTLVGVCRFMYDQDKRPSLERLLQMGKIVSACATRRASRQNFQIHVAKMLCPHCAREGWKEFGAIGVLWPHLGPMVEACWRHGCLLGPWTLDTMTWIHGSSACRASAAQVRYARNMVRLCDMGNDVMGTCAFLADCLQGLGFASADGDLSRSAFTEKFVAYVDRNVSNSLHKMIVSSYHASKHVSTFLRSRGEKRIHPLHLTLLLGFIDEFTSAGAAVIAANRTKPPNRSSWKSSVEPEIPPGPYERGDAMGLLLLGCSYQTVASLTGWPLESLQQTMRKRGLREKVIDARERFLIPLARERWIAIREAMRTDIRPALRADRKRLDNWLNKHDKAWRTTYLQRQTKKLKFLVKVPETEQGLARLTESLRIAADALVARGHRKVLSIRAMANESGIPVWHLRQWLASEERIQELYDAIVRATAEPFPRRGGRARAAGQSK